MTQIFQNQNRKSWHTIQASHYLCDNIFRLQTYYDYWAQEYNRDVCKEAYAGPLAIAEFYHRIRKQQSSLSPETVKILDAGCGTGLVGLMLKDFGYSAIDGFDLSEKMIELAKKTQSYQSLKGGVDLNQLRKTYEENQYDACLACGVFTLGHVPPEALTEMIRVTRSGGMIVVSTCKKYYETTHFQAVVHQLQNHGKINLLQSWKNAPYLLKENSHYWAFQVC